MTGSRLLRIALFLIGITSLATASAAPGELAPTPAALAQAMQGHRVVLLGEVHDNDAQHALRAAALCQWIAKGARPAIAFEQFDREHQADIDRARRERPKDADYLIDQAKAGGGWRWASYRPFVALALEFDLPIVAANLSRGDAMHVATDGYAALFDAATSRSLHLDDLPAHYLHEQQRAIAEGHCNQLPADEVPALVRAQAARDITLARSIQPYVDRGVVLLTGNGHARRDVGVRFWLPREVQRHTISIGMLERDDGAVPESAGDFDAYVMTERAERPDPCEAFTRRTKSR